MATSLAPTTVWSGEGVRVTDVARHIREVRAQSGGDDVASTLTSVMNLVVWSPRESSASDVEAVADALSDHHPSRVIIVVPSAEGGDRIDARVEVMSNPHKGSNRALLVEQVILTLHGAIAAHAGSAVIPLLRSELPTFLWWPAAPDPSSPTFAELVRVSDRLVTETGRELRGRAALTRLADVAASSSAPVTDLAWAMITPWRQIVATSLRGETLLQLRVSAASATISIPTEEPPLEALLLAGWLADIVGDHIDVRFVQAPGHGDILGVELDAAGSSVLELARDDGPSTVTMKTAVGGPRCLPMPQTSRTELLAGELELRGHDRQLERALIRARDIG
jgi:glucose-6-phosphate dehydrogenase assembly protein OpcA